MLCRGGCTRREVNESTRCAGRLQEMGFEEMKIVSLLKGEIWCQKGSVLKKVVKSDVPEYLRAEESCCLIICFTAS